MCAVLSQFTSLINSHMGNSSFLAHSGQKCNATCADKCNQYKSFGNSKPAGQKLNLRELHYA